MNQKKKVDWLHIAISWGASVVIVGALFKILHLGGIYGNYMIGLGLGIEAFLFFLTGFFPPPKELPWHLVYPELSENYTGGPAMTRATSGPSSAVGLDKMMKEAKIGPELIESLGNGLRTFGDKVAAISKVADMSSETTEFVSKVKSATSHFDKLAVSFEKASSDISIIASSVQDSTMFKEEIGKLARNLASLNSVYGNMLTAMGQSKS